MIEARVGLIGCGNMGDAIAKAMRTRQLVAQDAFYVYDIDTIKAQYVRATYGAIAASSNGEVFKSCDVIILAVKPQDIEDVLKLVWHTADASKLLISIAAGKAIPFLSNMLREGVRIIRAMPNMPAVIGCGMTAIAYGDMVTDDDKDIARRIFAALGEVLEVEEDLMDAVTAISGSGPAYYFYLTQMLYEAAVEFGMEKDKARLLAIQTAFGSAQAMKEGVSDCVMLRGKVTSKGGTTEAAFKVFERSGLGDILKRGIKAAAERSKEISGG